MSVEGLTCCATYQPFGELLFDIISDGEGGLLFRYKCRLCAKVLRTDDFAYPPDAPQRRKPGRPGG